MERPPLSFAEVLDEELLFLRRRRAERPASSDRKTLPRLEWQFRCEDFRELLVLKERLAQETPPVRYALLAKTAGENYCDRFNALAGDTELLSKLLGDTTFAGKLLQRPDIVRRILATSRLRRTLLDDRTLFERLLEPNMLRVTVAAGNDVAILLDEPDVRAAVRAKPQLLGSIIASPLLRNALTEKAHRRRLAEIAGVEKKSGVLRKAAQVIKTGFLRLIGRAPAPPRPPAASELDFAEAGDVLDELRGVRKEAVSAAD